MDPETFLDRNKGWVLPLVLIALAGSVGFAIWQVQSAQAEESASLALAEVRKPEELLKVAETHAGTQAAGQALLYAGDQMLGESKWDEAASAFKKFTEQYPKHGAAPSALIGLGASLEGKGDLDGAAVIYQRVFEQYATSHRSPEARVALGRIYEAKNQLPLARQIYSSVSQVTPQSSWASVAVERLRALEGN